MNPSEIREWFPHTEHTNYLNHAATSPLSTRVTEALKKFIDERHGSNIDNYWTFAPIVEETRSRLAGLLKCSSSNVDLVPYTSYALNILARGLDWKAGDRVAIPGCEFPANVYPFLPLREKGVSIDFIPHQDGTFSLEDVKKNLHPRTRLLTVSWVQFLSGFQADLEALGELCHERGVLFCVDAIQGLGALVWPRSPEEMGVDFVAGGAQKWLMATQGVGYLYVSNHLLEEISSPVAGWFSGPVDWNNFLDYRLDLHPDAKRYRIGTMNNMGIAAFHASLGQYLDVNPSLAENHILSLVSQLRGRLSQLGMEIQGEVGPKGPSGIVTVKHPLAEEIVSHLSDRKIEVAYRNRMIRFSPTYYNTPAEIESAVQEVADFLNKHS